MAGRYSDYIKSSNLRRKAAATAKKRLETLCNFQSCVTEAFDPIDSSEKNWSPYKERQRCDKAIMKAHAPGASWESFPIKIMTTKGTYDEARLLLPKAMQTSDLQTEDEVDQRPAYIKRRKITPKRWISDSESDEEQPQISKGKKKRPTALPTAPYISPPRSLSVPSSPMGETPTNRSHQPAFSPQMTARRQSVPHSLSAPSHLTSFQPSCERFPLCTLEDLRQVETKISVDTDFKEKLVTYFSLVGGLTIKETVWRVLGKMVSNTLAKTINWRGVNGKTGFESLGLKDVVSKSVRRNSVTANASDGETEHFIKRWLQLASDRDGGRRERALRLQPPGLKTGIRSQCQSDNFLYHVRADAGSGYFRLRPSDGSDGIRNLGRHSCRVSAESATGPGPTRFFWRAELGPMLALVRFDYGPVTAVTESGIGPVYSARFRALRNRADI
ncbi:uncharacterized protein PEZ65_001879 [Lycodopsis pacificus]